MRDWTQVGQYLTPLDPRAAVFTAEEYTVLDAWRRQRELERLVDLPETDRLREKLANCQQALGGAHGRLDLPAVKRLQNRIGALQARLALAEQRDAILVFERPDGCWCLGLGGQTRRYLPATDTPDNPEGEWIWDTYCDCPDGMRVAAEHTALRQRVAANRRLSLSDRLVLYADIPERYRDWTLDTFPASPKTAPALHVVRRWCEQTAAWLLLWGPVGVGKTGLAVGALLAVVTKRQAPAKFLNVPDWTGELRQTYDHGAGVSESALLGPLLSTSLLVLDDLGAERLTANVSDVLYRVLNQRYQQQRQTLLTTNYQPSELAERLDKRIADRVTDACGQKPRFIVHLDGPNLRDKRGVV